MPTFNTCLSHFFYPQGGRLAYYRGGWRPVLRNDMKLFLFRHGWTGTPKTAFAAALLLLAPSLIAADPAEAARRSDSPSGFTAPGITGGDKLVRKVQQLLSDMGFYRGAVNGRKTRDLEVAIRRYQRRTGRQATGKVSEELINHLDTQSRVGVMLQRLDRTRKNTKEAARQALLGSTQTRGLISKEATSEVADPTRDASPCFRDPGQACLLKEAVESAKAIAKNELRDWAFGEILVSQAKAGFVEDAVATVRRIGDARLIIVALRDIARAQANAGLVEGALAAAAIIPDRYKRLEALAAVADIQVERGALDSALETAAQIAFEARRLESPLQRVSLLAQMAVVFNRVGNPKGGSRLLRDAQNIARSRELIRDTGRTERGAALRHVAAAFSEIGQPARALSLVEDVSGTYDRTAVLMSVATALAKAGETVAALETADQIGSPRYQSVVLGRIAVSQAKRGDHRTASKTIERALDQAREIKMPYARSYSIGQLSLSLIQIGIGQGAGLLLQAVQTADDIENERLRAYALWTAASAQARQGSDIESARTVALAEDATKKITSALSRVWMFGDLASEHARGGDRGEALAAFGRGLAIAENIQNAWGRARALAKLAGAFHDIP